MTVRIERGPLVYEERVDIDEDALLGSTPYKGAAIDQGYAEAGRAMIDKFIQQYLFPIMRTELELEESRRRDEASRGNVGP